MQETQGSRAHYAAAEHGTSHHDRLGPAEATFIAARDSFYMASVGETGWPYVQHRGGPAGFIRVLDETTIAIADFRGNRQYVSVGNLVRDDRVALILMDYANRRRLKILGHARAVKGDEASDIVERVSLPGYRAKVERALVIRIAAFDWNCPQHITERYTAAEVAEAAAKLTERISALEAENARLTALVAGRQTDPPS
jgi:predicted pyridoxine 5'-phosphate oxidase superfamily flavin-nucleotide-binding protein